MAWKKAKRRFSLIQSSNPLPKAGRNGVAKTAAKEYAWVNVRQIWAIGTASLATGEDARRGIHAMKAISSEESFDRIWAGICFPLAVCTSSWGNETDSPVAASTTSTNRTRHKQRMGIDLFVKHFIL